MANNADSRRNELGEALALALQRNATDVVMMHQAVADKVGIHITDLRCMNVLRVGGPAAAGELAAATGLTTGAITRMVDRLVEAGLVRREHDENDRRRVVITAVQERIDDIAPRYEPLTVEFGRVVSDYTDDQLEMIVDLFARLHEATLRVIETLRA